MTQLEQCKEQVRQHPALQGRLKAVANSQKQKRTILVWKQLCFLNTI